MSDAGLKEAFSEEWIRQNIRDPLHELVFLRAVIPWQRVIDQLSQFYSKDKGRFSNPLRVMVALEIIGRLRNLSDEKVVEQVKENRYIQYFCNVPDEGLQTFINPSSLCTFRKRVGSKGIDLIDEQIFKHHRRSGVIKNDAQLIDSTVLPSQIIYPTDVLLLYKAFGKMKQFATNNSIPLWWDEQYVKRLWRAYNLAKKQEKIGYLWDFYLLFTSALALLRIHVQQNLATDKQREKGAFLVELLSMLDEQTQQKLSGEKHIDNRIVSLDEIDARPIVKGKSYPTCEFGSTLQVSFNRDGFMITAENFIGQPNDKTLYPSTVRHYKDRMKDYPEYVVTDLGSRSKPNLKVGKGKVAHVFLGRSEDVVEKARDFCRSARSATEGFIAVAKNWRGFGKSLYKGFEGDKIWTRLCQIAYNLKKLVQLYRKEKIEEKSLIKLGLSPA